jgi:signal transduction histidine kinase
VANINLVSVDRSVYDLCIEVLATLPVSGWMASPSSQYDGTADLHVWNYQPDVAIPDGINPSQHIFLVSRSDLTSFRERIGIPGVNVILKPVSRVALSSQLALAISANEEQVTAESSFRADRDAMLQCLIQANLRFQEYDQERTNFLSRAMHDFLAPLTTLSGYCSLMLNELLGGLNANQREVMERMQHSAKRLSRLANSMFELSVGGQIKRTPRAEAGDVRKCVDQAIHEMRPLADSKHISYSVNLVGQAAPLFFESDRIEQVIINILDNACRFTPPYGQVEIQGYPFFWERRKQHTKSETGPDRRHVDSRDPNSYRIDVRNSGEPIPDHQLKRIFEEYTSYAGSHDRSGAGLGLAISYMILQQHNGHIWAENSNIGPQFAFVLPFADGRIQNKQAPDEKTVLPKMMEEVM